MGLDVLPSHHSGVRGHVSGTTDRGLRFDIEVTSQQMPLTANGRARRTMELREKIMAHKGLTAYEGYRRTANVEVEGVEEKTTILLRIADGQRIHRFNVDVSPDGFYSSGRERSTNLRDLVRDLAFNVEEKCGLVGRVMRM